MYFELPLRPDHLCGKKKKRNRKVNPFGLRVQDSQSLSSFIAADTQLEVYVELGPGILRFLFYKRLFLSCLCGYDVQL